MIQIKNVTHSFGGRVLFRDVSSTVAPGEHVGIIGPNGSGKSTLLRIVAGELHPDAGHIERPRSERIGYLRQSPVRGAPSLESTFPTLALALRGDALLADAAQRLALADSTELPAREQVFDELLTGMEHVADTEIIEVAARGIGADFVWFERVPAALWGGEFAKLALLDLVAMQPDALLLDEPTNHLDSAGIEWLTGYIEGFAGPVLTVSHDRAFLDAAIDGLLVLDPVSGAAEVWHGDYTSWAEERARRLAEQWQAYEREQRGIRELRRTISAIESRSRNIEQRTIHFHYRKRAKKVARRSTTLKARLERQAASGEQTERPAKEPSGLRTEFTRVTGGAVRLVEVADATIAIGDRVLLEGVSFTVSRGQRTFITGPNGTGKSTLLRALIGASNADRALVRGGVVRLAGSARLGVMRQDEVTDWPGETPLEVIRSAAQVSEVEASNLLHRFVFAHDLARLPLDRLSEGERRRLQFVMLVGSGANLLVLDEPTHHLDLPSREAFEAALAAYEGAVLAVSHDRYFVDQFADEEWVIADGRLHARGADEFMIR